MDVAVQVGENIAEITPGAPMAKKRRVPTQNHKSQSAEQIRPRGPVISTPAATTPAVLELRYVTGHVHGLLRSPVLKRRISTAERRDLSRVADADTKAKRIIERLIKEPRQAMSATALAGVTGIPRKEVRLVLLGLELEVRRGKRTLYAADPEKFRTQETKTYVLVRTRNK